MGKIILTNLFLKFVNLFFLLFPFLMIQVQPTPYTDFPMEEIREAFKQRMVEAEINKMYFVWLLIGFGSFMNGLLLYEKYLRNKLDRKIKQEELIKLEIENIILKTKIEDEKPPQSGL